MVCMEEKELKIKIEEYLRRIKEMIASEISFEKIKEEQRILNELLKKYLEEK